MTEDERNSTEEYIRSALTATRLVAGREIVFRPDGITVIDPFSGKHHFSHLGTPPSKDLINEAFGQSFYSYTGSRDREMKASGHGAWCVTEKDGNFVLKTVKKRVAALEALVTANPEDFALMRSLYGIPNVDIIVACEGDTRTRDIALAFASELNLSGHRTTLNLAPEHQNRYSDSFEAVFYQEGSALFDVPRKAGQEWIVENASSRSMPAPPPSGISRVVVYEDENAARKFGRITEGSFAPSRRLAVLVGISLQDSTPTATVVLSKTAKAAARSDLVRENAPWTLYNERKAARLKSRPSVAKTWHQTTDQVARAFVARQAPRGFVSNKTLFFHGPVAFAVYERNPIAAFVDLPDGQTLMFSGRAAGQHNTLAATVSSAMGDIGNAVRPTNLKTFYVGELTDFLTLGDLGLNEVAFRVGYGKKEREYPSSCSINPAKLEEYIIKRRKRADAKLEHLTSKNSAATYTKAGCWGELASIAKFRDEMVTLLGISLPDMGDAAEFTAMGNGLGEAAERRQSDLRKLRTAKELAERETARNAERIGRPLVRDPFRHVR
jgi:hypothetical protein